MHECETCNTSIYSMIKKDAPEKNKQSGSRTPQRKKKEKKKGDKNRSQTLFRFIEDKVLQKNLSIVGM